MSQHVCAKGIKVDLEEYPLPWRVQSYEKDDITPAVWSEKNNQVVCSTKGVGLTGHIFAPAWLVEVVSEANVQYDPLAVQRMRFEAWLKPWASANGYQTTEPFARNSSGAYTDDWVNCLWKAWLAGAGVKE